MIGIAAIVSSYVIPLQVFCLTDFDLDHKEKYPEKKSASTSVPHLGL